MTSSSRITVMGQILLRFGHVLMGKR